MDPKHTITEQDIKNNPELEGQVEVGEEVELGPEVNEDGTPKEPEEEDWAAQDVPD